MKKRYSFPIKTTTIILLIILCIPIFSLSTSAATPLDGTLDFTEEGSYTQRIEASGNFEVVFSFVMETGPHTVYDRGSLTLDVYDGDFETHPERQSDNYIQFRSTGFNDYKTKDNYNNENRWRGKLVFCSHHDPDKPLVNKKCELTISRWKNRLAIVMEDEDGIVYRNMVYKSKRDMNETLYLRLSAVTGHLSNIQYHIGETNSYWTTFRWSNTLIAIVGIISLLVLLIINIACSEYEKDYFGGALNTVTGGLWGIALSFLVGLLIPGGKPILESLIRDLLSIPAPTLPQSGLWFWIIIIICFIIVIGIWMIAMILSGKNIFRGTLLMLIFSTIHTIILYFLIGVTVRMILLGIFLCILFAGGGLLSSSSSTSTDAPHEKEYTPDPAVKVWRQNGLMTENLKVNSTGDYYYDPDDGEWHKIKK